MQTKNSVRLNKNKLKNICCWITNYPRTQWLKKTHLYYLTASLFKKSSPAQLAVTLSSPSHVAAAVPAWLECNHHEARVGKDMPPSSHGCRQDPVPHGLLYWGFSAFLGLGIPNMEACFIKKYKMCKKPIESSSKMEATVFCNQITEVTSHPFCCTLLVRIKSLCPAHTQGCED